MRFLPRPYLIRGCYFAQVEVWAMVGLRLGFTALGLAYRHPWPRRRPWWLPHFRLSIWEHTGQCDQRWVFRIRVGRHSLGFRTRGDARPDLATYGDAGWHLA